jgi:hypothetical protein
MDSAPKITNSTANGGRDARSPTAAAPQSIQPSQIRHLTEVDLARRWRMSERTLQAWRWKKVGPPHIKFMGKVLYRVVDVIEFELANLVKADR